MRRIINLSLFTAFALLICIGAADLLIRALGFSDADGQFYFNSGRLRPYVLPLTLTAQDVADLESLGDEARFQYDPDRGWVFRPGLEGRLFTINSAGMRADREFAPEPPPGKIRIALYGDSFTAGDDVADHEAWAALLEAALAEQGIEAEVLNFGVSAYGMDQIYLHWQITGPQFQPDLVLYGFQAENLHRNMNIFRALYPYPFRMFSKPRFVLEGENLRPVNQPAIPPSQIVETLAAFPDHPLATYEGFYTDDYQARWWMQNRFVTMVADVLSGRAQKWDGAPVFASITPGSELVTLGETIIDAFASEVEASGARFVVAHLPGYPWLLELAVQGQPQPHEFLLEGLAARYPLIRAEGFLDSNEGMWTSGGHYTPEANQRMADFLAEALAACLNEGRCT